MKQGLWILAVLLSHWRRHPMQLTTLMVGLISATALWSGVQALNQQARISYDRAAAVFGGSRPAMLVGHMIPHFLSSFSSIFGGRDGRSHLSSKAEFAFREDIAPAGN